MKMYMRIRSVDMFGYWGRDNHPEPEHEGRFVRIHSMATEYAGMDEDADSYLVFTGVVVDENGDDIPGEEVELIDHEMECQARDGTADAVYGAPFMKAGWIIRLLYTPGFVGEMGTVVTYRSEARLFESYLRALTYTVSQRLGEGQYLIEGFGSGNKYRI